MSQDPKVVSTEVVTCHRYGDEGVQAVLVVFDNGHVEVHCEGNCDRCHYASL